MGGSGLKGESSENETLGDNVEVVDDESNKEENDNETLGDNVEVVDDMSNKEENEIVEPKIGMKFDNYDDVFEFYKSYAKLVGFPVRKRSTRKGKDGVLRYVTFACSREGQRLGATKNSLKPQPSSQTGCKARVTACSDVCGTWRINLVHLEHNHLISPSKSWYYRCNRDVSAPVKRKLEINDRTGIKLYKSFNSVVVEAGGYENMACLEKDCRNYIEKVRRLKLGEGDAVAIQAYFLKMQAQNTGFFFSMDLDEEGRLKNVFWADGRSREAYKEFGDVVTFDTTYLTNKYDMPFAPFVGVNHHGQSILFGCGLISNEDTETFVWLFKTWLACMSDRVPNGIITDQDRAMQNAIEIVFSKTKHRWCLWHIMKKLPEKLGSHKHYDSISFALQGLVYDTQSAEEFEKSWSEMVEKYVLQQNNWLSGLYKERGRWVPCFLKTSFWAGMSTTQRSESMNAFFDGYVNSKTTLKQFVEQYDNALRSKVEKECQADFRSFLTLVPCATKYEMEKQFQGVYTISKFKEFQEEFTGKVYCEVISSQEGCMVSKYEVREDIILGVGKKKKVFTVSFQRDECDVQCSCHMFEFRGIICRHAISVLIRNDVALLPNKYILRRWRKDVNRSHTRVKIHYDGWISSPEQLRYDQLCHAFTKVADLAADDEERTRIIMDWIDNQTKELSTSTKRLRLGSGCNFTTKSNVHTDSYNNIKGEKSASKDIRDPKTAKTKGREKKDRKKSFLEKISRKKKKEVSTCEDVKDGQTNNNSKRSRKKNNNVTSRENGKDGENSSTFSSQVLEVIPTQESIALCQTSTRGVYPQGPSIYAQKQFLDPQYQLWIGACGKSKDTVTSTGNVQDGQTSNAFSFQVPEDPQYQAWSNTYEINSMSAYGFRGVNQLSLQAQLSIQEYEALPKIANKSSLDLNFDEQ